MLSVLVNTMNTTTVKTFGKPVMFNFDANFAAAGFDGPKADKRIPSRLSPQTQSFLVL